MSDCPNCGIELIRGYSVSDDWNYRSDTHITRETPILECVQCDYYEDYIKESCGDPEEFEER